MCGIAGFLAEPGRARDDDRIARAMADAIARRGPDDHGVWSDREAGIAFAHRRLSIVDLTAAGHQPMTCASGRYVITFNGEIYNHGEIRAELERTSAAPSWRGHSDTEILLAAISAWGVSATLRRCAGMFAFALWDRRERTLTLTRDRLGEKPLYYGSAGRTFLFGSELSALKAHPDWVGEIDRTAVSGLLRLGYVKGPRSIYRGIAKLPPGTFLSLKAGEQDGRIETYWSAQEVAEAGLRTPFEGSPAEAVEAVEALIRTSLEGQMMADVPVGAFLSGGIDSSTVVALMQAMSTRPVRTFSIGFKEAQYDEAPHAKAVARHIGTEHTELYVTPQHAMDVIPRLPSLYNEPFADVSQIPTFLVSELTRRHVTVSLSGDGGDELFSGYSRYRIADRLWQRLSRIPSPLRHGAARLALGLAPATWDRLLTGPRRLAPSSVAGLMSGDKIHKAAGVIGLDTADDIYSSLISLWQTPGDIVIGVETDTTAEEPALAAGCPVRRMMFRDLVSYLPDDILVKVDRASMAVSLEARVPLLDHRLVEFSWRLPLSILRRDGVAKWPLRQVLERYVPRSLTERPKMGFGVPIDAWLRGGLRDWAESLLDERTLGQQGILRAAPIRAAWKAHLDGSRNFQYQLWTVLMFQAWLAAEGTVDAKRPAAVHTAVLATGS